jgi:predicted Zn-dependent protease
LNDKNIIEEIIIKVKDFFNRMSVRTLINRGRIMMENKKYDKAKNSLLKAKAIDSHDSTIYYLLGLVEARQNNFNEAIPYLRSALELNPSATQYKFDLALSYMENEEYDKSEELFDDLMYTYSEDQSLLVYVCELYQHKGELDKAIKIIEAIPYEERGEPRLPYQLAKYYYEQDKDKESILDLLDEAKSKAKYLRDKSLVKEIEDYENEIV